MGLFDFLKTSKDEPQTQQPTWDPNTLTMQQPSSPAAPSTDRVVAQQPTNQENMQMKLRGGGGGDVCCGVCAGLLCFECCC